MATIEDVSLDFSGGQDASQIPARVRPTEYYSGINVSAQRGILTPRFGVEEDILSFDISSEFTLPTGLTRPYDGIYEGGRFQALIPYSVGNELFIIAIISGQIFCINQNTFKVTLIPISDGSILNENSPRINWSPAGPYLLIFDYPAYPVIIDGFTARRADPTKMEIPVSVLGTYNQNRVCFANIGNEWSASDPAAYGFPDGPLSCTEILTPASSFFGQIFQLSTNYNNDSITGMGFLQVVDTSTGIGPLLVSTQNAIFFYHTELPRNNWEATQFGGVFVNGIGFAGPRAFTNVNSDIFFVSKDGQVRSASMSRDEQGKWSKTPISKEVQNFLQVFDPDLISYSSITYFKNKIFITANPYRTFCTDTKYQKQTDVAFGGMVVIELDNISTLNNTSPPAWVGLWTPFRPMDMIVNDNRCFAMGKTGGKNTLYEINPNLTYDIIGPEKKIRQIKTKVYTREYDFQNSGFNNKLLTNLILNVYNIKGDFKLKISYRPSQSTEYFLWQQFLHNAPWRICNVPQGCEWEGFAGHQFREFYVGSPIEAGCDPVTQENMDTCRRVQLLLETEGITWEIHEIKIVATIVPQNETQPICNQPIKQNIVICAKCNTDWEIPDICQENLQT